MSDRPTTNESTPPKGLSLSVKIITLTVALVIVAVAANFAVLIPSYRNDAEAQLMEKAAAFTAVADEAKNHSADLLQNGSYRLDELLEEAVAHVDQGGSYTETRFFGVLPVVAGWTTAQRAAAAEGIDFAVPAFDARNPKNEVVPGSFRATLLADLKAQHDAGGANSIGRINRETNTLHYMRAIELDASCMICHGDPKKYDADGDGRDPLGFPMEGWEPGDTHGAYEVAMPLDELDGAVAGFIQGGMMTAGPVIVIGGLAFVFVFRILLGKPLAALASSMTEIIRDSDLTRRSGIRRSDELGVVANAFDSFVASMHGIVGEIGNASRDVASAATEIAASNEEMAAGMTDQRQQTELAASSVGELNTASADIANQSADASRAAEQSRSSANEGGEVVHKTVEEITAIAVEVDESASAVSMLGKKSEQIGEIIGVINEIAEQTNLLALNAAIEAARAGDHGRGFAVVADEVRKLAERTTSATDEVSRSIREIQEETGKAVDRIESGSKRMGGGVELARRAGEALAAIVHSSDGLLGQVQTIAAAAQEQSASAGEIGQNIDRVTQVARESNVAADQAAQAAAELSRQSERMQSLVSRFKV
ncbi:MAG: methyl-accepting chemotaxis protein [Planctomycetota bacterium]